MHGGAVARAVREGGDINEEEEACGELKADDVNVWMTMGRAESMRSWR